MKDVLLTFFNHCNDEVEEQIYITNIPNNTKREVIIEKAMEHLNNKYIGKVNYVCNVIPIENLHKKYDELKNKGVNFNKCIDVVALQRCTHLDYSTL